jgi:hypothetical protein
MVVPPPLVDVGGDACVQYGVGGCDVPVPAPTHNAPIRVDSWQLVASPLGDARGWLAWLMFDASGTHIATAEYIDVSQLKALVPIIRDMLEFKGAVVYLNQHEHYLVSNRITPGLRYSEDEPFETWATGPCDWSSNYHCAPDLYTDPGEYHWYTPEKYQFAAMFPPFTEPTDPVGYHVGYEEGDAVGEVVRDVVLDNADRYMRHVRAWGNHPDVRQNAGGNAGGTISTTAVFTGTSLGIADPRHLHHYTVTQRADCNGDGVVGGPDFVCFLAAFTESVAEGYYPEVFVPGAH